MSAIQQFLSTLVANARKPGAIKSIAGQLAIAYGSNMVMETAAAAEERAEAANARLETILATTAAAVAELESIRNMQAKELHDNAETMVRNGFIDKAVRNRASLLGMSRATSKVDVANVTGDDVTAAAGLVDEGPPETIGAVRDLPGEEPSPPCARNLDCPLPYRHAGPCRPTYPPEMAGLLAGDGSEERPYREVETIASVLDDDGDDD